jgi:hypothetical protein
MRLEKIGNDRENCVVTRTSPWFRNLTPKEQAKLIRDYLLKIRSLEQPVSDIDLYITQVEMGIAQPDTYRVPSYTRRDVKQHDMMADTRERWGSILHFLYFLYGHLDSICKARNPR